MTGNGRDTVVVIGAGIVGVCAAWQLLRRGARVTLIDRDEPGRGCSFGNAGALSFGSVAPLAMPGVMRDAVSMLFDPAAPLRIPLAYLPKAAPWLTRFVRAARPDAVQRISDALSALLANSIEKHLEILGEVGASDIVRRTGQLYLYPDEAGSRRTPGPGRFAKNMACGSNAWSATVSSRSNPRSGPTTRSACSRPTRACRPIPIGRSPPSRRILRGTAA